MGSFSVMQNEIKLMDAKINMLKKKNESPEYYDQKKEILESRIEVARIIYTIYNIAPPRASTNGTI